MVGFGVGVGINGFSVKGVGSITIKGVDEIFGFGFSLFVTIRVGKTVGEIFVSGVGEMLGDAVGRAVCVLLMTGIFLFALPELLRNENIPNVEMPRISIAKTPKGKIHLFFFLSDSVGGAITGAVCGLMLLMVLIYGFSECDGEAIFAEGFASVGEYSNDG